MDTQLQSVIDGNITGVGSMSTGDVFANSTADNQWLGLGSTAGRIYFDDLSTDKISILDAYLGVGTSSVTSGMGLYVDRGIGLTAGEYLNIGTTYGSTGYGLREYNGSIQVKNLGGNWVDLVGGGYFDLYGNSAPTATVALDQSYAHNFGIGTTAASEKLHVVGNALITGTVDLGTNTISDGTLSGNWNFGSGNITSNGILTLTGIASTDSGSNVLIVDGSGTVKYKSFTSVSGTGTSNYLTRWLTSNTIGTGSIYDNGTNVGIGTTNMSYKLNIAGTSLHQSDAYFGNSTSYYVNASGNAKFQGLTLDETGAFGLSIGNGTTGSMKVGSASIKDDGTAYLSFDTTNNSADEFRVYDSGDLWSRTGSLISDIINSSTAVAYELDTTNDISTAGAKLLSLRTANVEKMYVDKDGYVGTTRVQDITASTKVDLDVPTTKVIDYMEYNSDANAQSAYAGTGYLNATGGTITYSGSEKIHTFTSSGTLSVTGSGSNMQVLVVAGGGSGGGDIGGGGGGGGVIYNAAYAATAQNYSITVGAGGAAPSTRAQGNNGQNSSFNGALTAIGGGGGGHYAHSAGSNGGSGGGGGSSDTNTLGGGTGTAGQGYNGGSNHAGANPWNGGGGGGAGQIGQSADTAGNSGNGGNGYTSSISGSSVTYAGGGGGGAHGASGVAGSGGTGGGGGGGRSGGATGGSGSTIGGNGTANRGGGGGGASYTGGSGTAAGSGGSGVVIVRYLSNDIQALSGAALDQGSNALLITAFSPGSLNRTLTRTIGSPIDLSNYPEIKLTMLATRLGSNVKIGLHDSGGTTTEITPNITSTYTNQEITWDISGVSNANKDAIDQIIITIVNADAYNTIYLDNIYASNPSLEDMAFSTNSTERMRITSAGNVGIGTTGAPYKLTVNGQPAANGYTTFTNYSDYRLKENINPLQDSYMSKLMQLNPVTYNYNELTGYDDQTRNRLMTGFVAQELKEVFPEMVGTVTINGTDYYDTNLSNLQLYLLKGIQEQQQQINDIKNTLASLNVEGLVGTNVQVNNDINVLGASTFNDVTVTGDVNIGQINIDSLNNTIQINGPNCTSSETLCNEQTLYIQKNLAGNLDIFNGNILLETNGSINIKGNLKAEEVTSKSYSVNMSGNTIGSGTITSGEKTVFIETVNVKESSKIFITAPNILGKAVNMSVTEKTPGQRFKVEIPEALDEDVSFDWWIINITE